MFYSHEGEHDTLSLIGSEICVCLMRCQSSRRGNMAWLLSGRTRVLPLSLPHADPSRLVATLGSKSTLKKINRKAILDVDIPKACQTITQPEAPMALRLQSNLL
jgi:hypothetical protein